MMDSQRNIPKFTHNGVLPPYVGVGPGSSPSMMSPYRTSTPNLVEILGSTPRRREILRGFLAYRKILAGVGLTEGFQWLDGSFVENTWDREPGDIDIVTFFVRPSGAKEGESFEKFCQDNLAHVFDRGSVKDRFLCDAFFVDLNVPPSDVVNSTRYWFGLFSHRRGSLEWKGLLQVPLNTPEDDEKAMQRLSDVDAGVSP